MCVYKTKFVLRRGGKPLQWNSPGKIFDWFRSIFLDLSSVPLSLFPVYKQIPQILNITCINHALSYKMY